MPSNYGAKSSWWTSILQLADNELLTFDTLYKGGILKLADNAAWLRDEIVRRFAVLAGTAAGTNAKVVGSVDLSTLTYDPSAGNLNGLTLQVQADTGGLYTVTFGSGPSAPTGPGDVASAIVGVTGGQPAAVVDSAGHLNVSSTTTGTGSTITVVAGTAVTALGFTNGQNASGVSSGADGISQVGGASVVGSAITLPAGTLRAMLQYLADHAGDATLSQVAAYSGASFTIASGPLQTFLRLLADKAPKLDGSNTFTGALTAASTLIAQQLLRVELGGNITKDETAISASADAITVDASSPVYVADAWTGTGGTNLAITLSDYAGDAANKNPEVEFYFYPTSETDHLTMKRGGGSTALVVLGTCYVRARWSHAAGKWRFFAVPIAFWTGSTNTTAYTGP